MNRKSRIMVFIISTALVVGATVGNCEYLRGETIPFKTISAGNDFSQPFYGPTYFVFTSREELESFWWLYGFRGLFQEIDFRKESVIALFSGHHTTTCGGLEDMVTGIERLEHETRIYISGIRGLGNCDADALSAFFFSAKTQRISGPWTLANHFSGIAEIREIFIDVTPNNEKNKLNPDSRGSLQVAILSSIAFDARSVNAGTLVLEGASVKLGANGKKFLCKEKDANADSLIDLVCQVDTSQLRIREGQAVFVLKAETFGGIPLRGEDVVSLVPK